MIRYLRLIKHCLLCHLPSLAVDANDCLDVIAVIIVINDVVVVVFITSLQLTEQQLRAVHNKLLQRETAADLHRVDVEGGTG